VSSRSVAGVRVIELAAGRAARARTERGYALTASTATVDLVAESFEAELDALLELASSGIGAGSTRDDHRDLADQIYACYARGRQVRDLASVVGTAALGEDDHRYLSFAGDFEQRFVNQGADRRGITGTLDLAWDLLAVFPRHELKRIRPRFLDSRRQPA
jgi:vacuolar-type H+-ATPase subunit B/Vma2